MGKKPDFSGYVTKNDILCSDGRIIRKDAFKHYDGKTVPLVWQHQIQDLRNVVGNIRMENREDGVYGYGCFNHTDLGQDAKELVANGDITSMSIYAKNVTQNGPDVLHGDIKEVSLVISGANSGAVIDQPIIHSDEGSNEMTIYMNLPIEFLHSDEEPKEEHKEKEPEKKDPEPDKKFIEDIYEGMTEDQKLATKYIAAEAMASVKEAEKEVKHSDEGGTEPMSYNVFEQATQQTTQENVISHSDVESIFKDAMRLGSLKTAVEEFVYNRPELAHADNLTDIGTSGLTYGIGNMDYLFPEAKTLNTPPEFIKRDTEWVSIVAAGVKNSPFSRVRSVFADITEDEARAKGYIKGTEKKEEVFGLLKRSTEPTTVYKLQKLDRDDIVDITDFDVVAWLKSEMQIMLDEELARAYLIGDGRLASDPYKINESHIRPILTDEDLFTIKYKVKVAAGADENVRAKAVIRAAVKSRKQYKGTGRPTLFTTEDWLTDMLLLENKNEEKLYKSEAELATAMRVSRIVTVPVMEGLQREDKTDHKKRDVAGIIVNLADYQVGTDKKGGKTMFDDFDIKFNQYLYLIETRRSGALVKPYSAIVLEIDEAAS